MPPVSTIVACSPSLGVSPHHATAEESGINNEKSLSKKIYL